MKKAHTRGAMALSAAAVLIPCGVWYALGTRQLQREAQQLEDAARREASSAAERMAARLAVRLEELNDHESNRPFIHYWRDYPPRGQSCPVPGSNRSPLARFQRHKMIGAHFQLDESGRISSPEPWAKVKSISFSDPTAVVSEASVLARPEALASIAPSARAAQLPSPDGPAQVTPFRWQTGAWANKPALMAVRQVIAANQTFVQGFVLDRSGLEHWTFEDGLRAELRSGEPGDEVEARLPIVGTAWHIRVDPRPGIERAFRRAAALRTQFHRSYFAGVLGAVLAGGCLVVLIRRSERLAEERWRFAAAAAHELRTPLAGIRLHGEMLALSLGNPGRVNEYARRITDEAERLTRLVSNVFSYTQVDQKLLRVRKELGDLGEVVREALIIVRPIVESAGATLLVEIEDGLPAVEIDKDAIHHMVRNLVDNAEKYSRQSALRRIEIAVRRAGDNVELQVRDHGPGVPATERTGIFRPFSRHSKNVETSGLGLGLSVVRTLAVAHGGSAEYSDAPGGGACFVVRFPAVAVG